MARHEEGSLCTFTIKAVHVTHLELIISSFCQSWRYFGSYYHGARDMDVVAADSADTQHLLKRVRAGEEQAREQLLRNIEPL
jgi:hypothetical protein